MRRVLMLIFLTLGWFVGAGCGAGSFKTGDPWNPNEALFFDDGVDLVKDLTSISGKWAYDFEKNLDGRVQLADLVAEIDIRSVQTTTDLEGATAKRIDVDISRILYGDTPSKTISLVSVKEARGHELLLRYERHLSGSYILFVRWFENEGKEIDNHFHLSPASEEMLKEVESRIDLRKREEKAHLAESN